MRLAKRISIIIEAVRAEWDTTEGKKPYFMVGHPREVFNTLSEKDRSKTYKYDKYPLVAFFERHERKHVGDQLKVDDFIISIITETSPHYSAEERYENVLIPTLIPLYDLLIKHLKASGLLTSSDGYTHTELRRLYWGQGDEWGNMFRRGNDALDAIVIKDMELNIPGCAVVCTATEDFAYLVTEDNINIIIE